MVSWVGRNSSKDPDPEHSVQESEVFVPHGPPPAGPRSCAPGGQGWPGASHGARPRLQVEPCLAVGAGGARWGQMEVTTRGSEISGLSLFPAPRRLISNFTKLQKMLARRKQTWRTGCS